MPSLILFILVLFVAYSNGANDNFKGVSTLFGNGTLAFRGALILATFATVLGSIYSVYLSQTLAAHFFGKGIVSDTATSSMNFHIAVASAVGITVILATSFGYPISTTHAIVGALIGAGIMTAGSDVQFSKLGKVFFLPLITSPIVAIVLGMISYNAFRLFHYGSKIAKKGWCVCFSNEKKISTVALGEAIPCEENGLKKIIGTDRYSLFNLLHCLSGSAVCFARGMNDTPKIVALMFIMVPLSLHHSTFIIASAMALGGIFSSRKVAETMSKKIVSLAEADGLAANLVTSFLVILSSKYSLPVSTTHVAVGSMAGVGVASKKLQWKMFDQIILSWLITLPIALLLSALFTYVLLKIN